jgi:hypothetical protein
MRAVGDSGRQAIAVDAAVEPVGEPQGDPLRLGETGPFQKPAQQGAERFFRFADELGPNGVDMDASWLKTLIPAVKSYQCLRNRFSYGN